MSMAEFSIDRRQINGVMFDFVLLQQLPLIIDKWRQARRRGYIAVTNPHSTMLCRRDREMARATAGAMLVLPDGVGIILAGKLLGYGRRHRVTGPDMMLQVCDSGRELGLRHFFYGGEGATVDLLTQRLRERFPGLKVVGTYCPPFRELTETEDAQVVARINATQPDVVWVGLGAPKQEKWMAAHAGRIQATTMVGVGAAFDFHSGNIPWAPRPIRKMGLEWAWRLTLHPRRMWRRNVDSPLFLLHVLAQMPAAWGRNLFQHQPPQAQETNPV